MINNWTWYYQGCFCLWCGSHVISQNTQQLDSPNKNPNSQASYIILCIWICCCTVDTDMLTPSLEQSTPLVYIPTVDFSSEGVNISISTVQRFLIWSAWRRSITSLFSSMIVNDMGPVLPRTVPGIQLGFLETVLTYTLSPEWKWRLCSDYHVAPSDVLMTVPLYQISLEGQGPNECLCFHKIQVQLVIFC